MAWAAAHPSRASVIVALVALILFLPGFTSLPVTDRDEARFAQASRQMVESGDLIDIRLQDVPRHKKPVGIYWLQAASVAALQGGPDAPIWMYRLPSLLSGVAAVVLTYAVALPLIGVTAAFWAALLMAAGLVMGGEARLAKADAALLAAILGCMAVLVRLYPRLPAGPAPVRRGMAALFWAGLAASILIKGPIGPLVLGSTMATLSLAMRDIRWLAPLRWKSGLVILAALVLPWFIAISITSGGAFWTESLVNDLIAKTAQGQESHGAPPGSYLLALWITFWPGSLILACGLPMLWTLRAHPALFFALAWIVPTWVLFEATPTKLVHYVLPLYPALAILAALAWHRRPAALSLLSRRLAQAALLVPALLIAAILMYALRFTPAAIWPALAAVLPVAALALLLWHTLARDLRGATVVVLVAMAFATYAGAYASLARLDYLWPSTVVAHTLAAACPDPVVVTTAAYEPSLVFLTNRHLRQTDGAGAADVLAGKTCAVVLLDNASQPAFAARAQALDLVPRAIGTVTGLAIGGGQRVSLTLFSRPTR